MSASLTVAPRAIVLRSAGSGLACLGLALAGCATAPPPSAQEQALLDRVGIAEQQTVLPASAAERAAVASLDGVTRAAFWGAEYSKNPADLEAARAFAETLREIGSLRRAEEVASQALTLHPTDADLLLTLGRTYLGLDALLQAVDTLERAALRAPTDWRPVMMLGVAQDRLERHATAQASYTAALRLSPDNPAILSNLGLSQALAGEAATAEVTLRRAVSLPGADVRVRQNLALVIGLQGRFDEAETLARADLTPEMAEANVSTLRAMLAPQTRRWGALRGPTQE
jgi:Flp pilus assembly protein TadD